ncbi:DUF4352 domain-containing protein [Streptomonospora wellingtoniae]|uniref:DUF4352 domain-containing protein n=1 Tax=Streptomonospora wellingtoniae TaxID=3075544 RepID=A0ABU2KQS5_9ACTN|nr:hypothetical protein [Streptomonospora sp. DSM 45055]MDT0301636.1 hypothetical protein [Streptomonospora sp. DSM 45055]
MFGRLLAPPAAAATCAGLIACLPVEVETPASPSPEPEKTERSGEPERPREQVRPKGKPPEAPDLTEFHGMSGSDGYFDMRINEAYVDDDDVITDGAGTSSRAPSGSRYVVFNVQITNTTSSPKYFDWGGSHAYDVEGNQYVDDYDAALTTCDDYCGEELNPGGTVETDVIFTVADGVQLSSVELLSDPYTPGTPATLEP